MRLLRNETRVARASAPDRKVPAQSCRVEGERMLRFNRAGAVIASLLLVLSTVIATAAPPDHARVGESVHQKLARASR